MAKDEKIPNIQTDWEGYTGKRVQEFIKGELMALDKEKLNTNNIAQGFGNDTQTPMSQDAITQFLGRGYMFGGVITPQDKPFKDYKGNIFYIAKQAGTYTNFGGIVVADKEQALIKWNGSIWSKELVPFGSDIEVSQEFGDSTTKVMSQKVLTDELNCTTSKYNLIKECYLPNADKSKIYGIADVGRKDDTYGYSFVIGEYVDGRYTNLYAVKTNIPINEEKDSVIKFNPTPDTVGYIVINWEAFELGKNTTHIHAMFNENIYDLYKNPIIASYINVGGSVTQELGDSDSKVISQKVVSEKLNLVDYPFSDSPQKEFVKECLLIGGDITHSYKIGGVGRQFNEDKEYYVYILDKTTDKIAAYMTQRPLNESNDIVLHLPKYNGSNIEAYMVVNWSVFSLGTNTGTSIMLNTNIFDKAKNPIITSYLETKKQLTDLDSLKITDANIDDDTISISKLKNGKSLFLFKDGVTPDYSMDFKEVYITNLKGKSRVALHCYSKGAYIALIDENGKFESVFATSGKVTKNNFVYPISVYSTSKPEEYPEKTILGYVVFKDVDDFLTKPEDSYRTPNINLEYATNLSNSVQIAQYLNSGKDEFINIALPDTINAVVGDTLQLYYKSIFRCINPYIYDCNVNCTKDGKTYGHQYPRYYEFTPEVVGEYPITFSILDNNHKLLGIKQTKIVVKNKVKSPNSKINVLCCGASATSGGDWAGEFKRRLTQAGGSPKGSEVTNVNFVGRKLANGANFEATGGYQFSSYTSLNTKRYRFYFDKDNLPQDIFENDVFTNNGNEFTIKEINVPTFDGKGNISCEAKYGIEPESSGNLVKLDGTKTLTYYSYAIDGNPFVYNGAINMQQYADDYCNPDGEAKGRIDLVYTELFGNGTPAFTDDVTSRFDTMMAFINQFRATFPNCKFAIGLFWNPDEKGGMGVNYGSGGNWSDQYGIKYTNMVMCNALQKYITDNNLQDYVQILNWLNEFDAENDFQQKEKKVNVRATKTEVFGNNGVHPTSIGYNQMADTCWRHFICNFCQ